MISEARPGENDTGRPVADPRKSNLILHSSVPPSAVIAKTGVSPSTAPTPGHPAAPNIIGREPALRILMTVGKIDSFQLLRFENLLDGTGRQEEVSATIDSFKSGCHRQNLQVV